MLYADYVRGKDSTGVAVVHSNRAEAGGDLLTHVFKRAVASYDFIHLPGYKRVEAFTRPVLMLGHNRAATRGTIIDANAHPFVSGDIVLAHNGTLTNKHVLPDSQYLDTDSECIANALNEKSVEEVANLMEGAWALVWWNKQEKTLNFLRNKERHLYYCTIENEDTLMWSSNEHLLRWTAEHNKITIDGETKDAYGGVVLTDINHLYSFKEGEIEPTITEIKIKPKKSYYPTRFSGNKHTSPGGGSGKKQRKKEEIKRRRNVLNVILSGMIGQQIPFDKTSSHNYENKSDKKTGVYIMGTILKRFSFRVFPEFTNVTVRVSSLSQMSLKEINAGKDHVWAGMLSGFTVSENAERVSIALADVAPFPMYNIEKEIETLEEAEGEDIKKLDMVEGPEGIFIPYTDFRIMTQKGCSCCASELTKEMAGEIVWVDNDYPVCPKCVTLGRDQLSGGSIDTWIFNHL